MIRATALLALAATACSYVTVSGPAPGPVTHWAPCTDNRFWPIVDTATAIVYGGGGAVAIGALASERDSLSNLAILLLAPVVAGVAVGFGVSAYRGFDKVSKCRARHDAYEQLAPR